MRAKNITICQSEIFPLTARRGDVNRRENEERESGEGEREKERGVKRRDEEEKGFKQQMPALT